MAEGGKDRPKSPYDGLEARAFWRSGVAEAGAWPPPDLFRPRFPIPRTARILTAGSCFAQHVGKALRANGFSVIDAEPMTASVPPEVAQAYGYGLYSARYGNIYTVRQLLQLLREAWGDFTPAQPVWSRGGRFFDAMRPSVEPDGMDSPDEVAEARAAHLAAVRRAVAEADVMVFTLGLTEAWEDAATGTVYPTASGTIADAPDPAALIFRNHRAADIRAEFDQVREVLRAANPDIRFLLTVSPVPLTATATADHVLAATVHSKSVLRAVAGELRGDYGDVDYFPSYEIVTSPAAGGGFFEPNLRTVRPKGVARVMAAFLDAVAQDERARPAGKPSRAARAAQDSKARPDDVVCEEQLLEAFRK